MSALYLIKPIMCTTGRFTRFRQIMEIEPSDFSSVSISKLKKTINRVYELIPKTILCLLSLPVISATATDPRSIPQVGLLKEFRPIGGVGNNLKNPDLDAATGTPEIALTPLNFGPGPNNPLVTGPNPRTISNVIAGGTGSNGQNAETTDPVASAWLYVFGQFVDHDLDLEETPLTNPAINIPILPGDPNPLYAAGSSIAMNRSTRNPETNTIINSVAGYLDLSQLYGVDTTAAAQLRYPDGTLACSYGGLYLPIVYDTGYNYFVTGDPRVMENPELSAVTILFMREHNFWVATLKAQHPNWTGDQLYNMAKAINTAEYQNIVYKEFVPLLAGPVLGPYNGYNPNVNAQVTQEFSTAAFRLHTQISDTQTGIDTAGNEVFSQSLADAFFNTATIDISNGINPLLRSLGTDFAQATDVYTVSVLRNLLVAGLVGGGVDEIDLIAIDIQRERDVGLGTLNQTRTALGLKRFNSFAELTPDPILQKNLWSIYHNIDNVDLFIGGLAESHARGATVGPTFQAILARQFWALRAGDRFFWQNEGFDQNTAAMISNTRLSDIVRRNADTPYLQANLFISAPLPTHPWWHVKAPAVINGHGRKRPIFLD
jgi:peroxidase